MQVAAEQSRFAAPSGSSDGMRWADPRWGRHGPPFERWLKRDLRDKYRLQPNEALPPELAQLVGTLPQ